MTFYAIVVLAGIVNLGCYAIISWKLSSWINCFSMYFGSTIAVDVIFGFVGLWMFGPGGSLRAFLYIYIAEMGCAIVTMAVVLLLRGPRLNWYPSFRTTDIQYLPWIILGVAILLYLPVLVEFRALLLTPRKIYEVTRRGYGINFIGSIFFTDIAFVLYLFKREKSRFGSILFFGFAGLFLYEHGSKGAYLEPVLIYLIYLVHAHGKRIRLTGAMFAASLVVIFVTLSFLATTNLKDPRDLFLGMANFADYNRNSMLVIDSPMKEAPFYGTLMLEHEFYARVPRALFPGKPKTYGMFKMAEHYQNEEYSADTGASAFSYIAYLYANFGPFSLIFDWVVSGLGAYISIGIIRRLKSSPSPGPLLILCFLSGAGVIPVVQMFVLPETIIIALIIDNLASNRAARITRFSQA